MPNKETLVKIAKEFDTPSYVFDADVLASHIEKMKEILGDDITLCYAMKANPFLVDAMKDLVQKYEVCSPGEFAICKREKIAMERIVLSGVNKEKKDIEHVMDDCGGVGIYTVESKQHLMLLAECAKERSMNIEVILRVTSGNQFGMDEEEIENIIQSRAEYEYVKFKGIQCYSGTQKKKIDIISEEIDWLDAFCDKLETEYGYKAEELEYGPGLPINYFEPDTDSNVYEMLEQFSEKLNDIRDKYHITLEIGRYMVATCGIFLSRIADMKQNKGQKYCIIDGGINHINYYGQTMAMKLPKIDFVHMSDENKENESVEDKDIEKWTICGSLCTVGDVIVKNLPLPYPAIGDLLMFHNIGAYSVTEGIYLFLSRRMPKIIIYSEKQGSIVIREDIASDLINSRKICLD